MELQWISDDIMPKPLQVLTSMGQIKAYANPTRMALLDLLAGEKYTVSGMAKSFGVHPANLTHHVRLLEKSGLIVLVEKRDTGKNLEKYYRGIASHYLVAQEELELSDKKAMALGILRDNLSDAIRTISDKPDAQVMALLGNVRLGPEARDHFIKKIQQVMDDFKKLDRPEGISYNLSVSLYPHSITVSSPDSRKLLL